MPNENLVLAIPNPLWNIAQGFAIYCEPSCCGVGAFELLPHHLKNWVTPPTPEEIALALEQADELLAEMKRIGPEASFEWINYDGPNWHRYWLEDLRECIVEATNPPQMFPDGSPFVREVTAQVRILTWREVVGGKSLPPQPLTGPMVWVDVPERPVRADITLSAPAVPRANKPSLTCDFPCPRECSHC